QHDQRGPVHVLDVLELDPVDLAGAGDQDLVVQAGRGELPPVGGGRQEQRPEAGAGHASGELGGDRQLAVRPEAGDDEQDGARRGGHGEESARMRRTAGWSGNSVPIMARTVSWCGSPLSWWYQRNASQPML